MSRVTCAASHPLKTTQPLRDQRSIIACTLPLKGKPSPRCPLSALLATTRKFSISYPTDFDLIGECGGGSGMWFICNINSLPRCVVLGRGSSHALSLRFIPISPNHEGHKGYSNGVTLSLHALAPILFEVSRGLFSARNAWLSRTSVSTFDMTAPTPLHESDTHA